MTYLMQLEATSAFSQHGLLSAVLTLQNILLGECGPIEAN